MTSTELAKMFRELGDGFQPLADRAGVIGLLIPQAAYEAQRAAWNNAAGALEQWAAQQPPKAGP